MIVAEAVTVAATTVAAGYDDRFDDGNNIHVRARVSERIITTAAAMTAAAGYPDTALYA